jgi:type I restriction enzyme S subunit
LLVKKINKKVELLKEQQMSLIDQYVTKGHNSNAEMKDSGVEWIGEIPKHWELTKIKYLSKIENGSTPKSNIEKYWDGLIKWFTPTDFKNISEDGFLNKPSRFISEDGLKNSGCSYVEQDSILMTTRAPVGNIAKVKKGFTFNQGCKSITPNEVNIDYLYFYLSTKDKVLNALSNGTTFQELSTVRLLNFAINLPSKTEQTEIVTFLKKNTSKIKKMIELLNTKVDRTKEYHQSLISSVVTGKVRVTEDMV